VVACVVVLGEGFDDCGLDDSKRLTRRQREIHSARIRESCLAWALGQAEAREIDQLDILRATHLAVRRALEGLSVSPDLVLVDGREVSGLGVAQRAIVKGDALSVSIAAASIVAKVARDEMMRDWDRRCPGYGLARTKGYASQAHREALRRLGPSQIHRLTFRGTERWLF
jgi:ribonuclease HII